MGKSWKQTAPYVVAFVAILSGVSILLYAVFSFAEEVDKRHSAPTPPKIILTNTVTNAVVEVHARKWRVIQKRSDGKYYLEFAVWHKTDEPMDRREEAIEMRDMLEKGYKECAPPSPVIEITNGTVINVVQVMELYSNIVNWVPPYKEVTK